MNARARLAGALAERAVLGTFLKLGTAESVDMVQAAGFDFAVLDLEHSQIGPDAASTVLLAARAAGLPVVVRVPVLDSGKVNRLLEAGAAGVQLSSVVAVGQSAALRSAMSYPPDGTRSISLGHPSADYGAMAIDDYLATQREHPPMVIGQLETVDYRDGFDAILEHLDVAFIGPTDLAVSAGTPGDLTTPRIRVVLERIALAARRTGTALGIWAGDAAAARRAIDDGYRYVVVSSDLAVLRSALGATLSALRET